MISLSLRPFSKAYLHPSSLSAQFSGSRAFGGGFFGGGTKGGTSDGSRMVPVLFGCTSCTSWGASPARVRCISCTGASPARVRSRAEIASRLSLYSVVNPFLHFRFPTCEIRFAFNKSSTQFWTVRFPISRSRAMLALLLQTPVPSSLAQAAISIKTDFRVGEPTLRLWTRAETRLLTSPPPATQSPSRQMFPCEHV